MQNIEITIQLDPVEDGANWIPKGMKIKGSGALIIGTNGDYRIAEENEAISEQLISCAETLKQTVSDFKLRDTE